MATFVAGRQQPRRGPLLILVSVQLRGDAWFPPLCLRECAESLVCLGKASLCFRRRAPEQRILFSITNLPIVSLKKAY